MVNMPVANIPRMMLDRVRVRILRIRSGMIGLASLDSRTKKATSSATDAPPKPRVWGDSHRYWVAVEMA